ncbi:radical SAM protein [Pectinatus sottacetonis]|uniref:radical SAM protein n=1 Tax=Pectinatus sottacetonis TaxID=1002795 RepID=UPI0018C612FF|nr:radical SAM protein [Pectinatus sottacetonis]
MKLFETVEKEIKDTFVNEGMKLLNKNPEKNIDRGFKLAQKFMRNKISQDGLNGLYKLYKYNPATRKYMQNFLQTTNKKSLEKFFINFFANATWFGVSKREKFLEEENTKIPFVILLSPSMRCNLRCTGCYAAKYSKKDDIPFEEIDRIIGEARELGIYYFIILGGEPFAVDYMLKIYEKYNDVLFTPFTNGTLFNEELADKLQKLGNVVPMFSLEGFEEQTDARRGKGVFKKVVHAMDLLKERGMLFGVSSAATRANFEVVSSDKFVDFLIEKGAKMSFYFIYMPVGISPDIKMMLRPEERVELGRRIRHIRTDKPYFAIDFFNDAPYIGGCIAGKYYCHINSKEEVEPCIFAHYACDNLKGKPLLSIFRSQFFKDLRQEQPYNKNLLLPCMMIDNTDVIRDIVKRDHAHPTDESAAKMINDPQFMRELDELAQNYRPAADKAWQKYFHDKGNYWLSKG